MSKERAEMIREALKDLESRPPRELRWNSFGEAKVLWIWTVLIGILLFIFLLGIMDQEGVPLFASKYGKPVQGIVIDHYLRISQGRYQTTNINLKVQYSIGLDQQTGTINVSQEIYENTPLGSTVAIHYLAAFPSRPALDADSYSFSGLIFFLLLVVGGLVYYLMRLRVKIYLLVHGKVVKGSITELNSKYSKFRTDIASFGGEHEFRTLPMSHFYCGSANSLGDEIIILRAPDNLDKYIVTSEKHPVGV
jgi:hypothetical protein